jgi:hypothetical protein
MKKPEKEKKEKICFCMFSVPKSEREKKVKKLPDSYMWFSLYSQT